MSLTQIAVLILAIVLVLAFATATSPVILAVLAAVAGGLVIIDTPIARR